MKQSQNKYPIYVISKGRWKYRHTSNALEKMGVPYRIVIEPQEYKEYSQVIDPKKILILPFSNLGLGSIPARNWVWDHSVKEGHEKHWILDDNIMAFYRFHLNKRTPVYSAVPFLFCEDYTNRFKNVLLSGMNYSMFVPSTYKKKAISYNTRIYSCILINNNWPLDEQWRGRYNEDTDLSLRVLKSGHCTMLFNNFLCDKMTTMVMKGGNSDELYQGKGRLKMAMSLKAQHPDVTEVVWKFNRWHHEVDYSQFKQNGLVPNPDWAPPPDKNYGLVLKKLADKK